MKSKGAEPRPTDTHHEHVLDTDYWGRRHRPTAAQAHPRPHPRACFTHRRPGPGKYLADRDVCLDTGLARLSCDLLDTVTATDGPGTGWDLHEVRHSGLTHLGEAGAGLLDDGSRQRRQGSLATL
ncbi:hypothetical protein OHB12_07890 [Nocardia sp. NBC_01730]|uniref:hypothetical protein n=1 Tax=Nocardia sp. NBC_01730 TaxID=2975998 RepID=UPI002E161BAF|nr:hypothetical protein OHB12_07890 [Nocardia sp. NBC_01730]